ncbi:putative nuclease HARBI1 [Merluccius polli]|uniref:Nuclease HARBI1 n=1 Tax=Merluccius polli TaxID=89951 RepID=A0AA47NWX3_MERPO|nr:putative nuclease HARBI1 [Merluccius polli]
MNGCHDDDWLISRFRFPKAISSWKSTELGPGLERQTARSHALPVPIQVLTTLGFLATGSFQRELADRSGMSQGALSRAIAAVLNGIIRISASVCKGVSLVLEVVGTGLEWEQNLARLSTGGCAIVNGGCAIVNGAGGVLGHGPSTGPASRGPSTGPASRGLGRGLSPGPGRGPSTEPANRGPGRGLSRRPESTHSRCACCEDVIIRAYRMI